MNDELGICHESWRHFIFPKNNNYNNKMDKSNGGNNDGGINSILNIYMSETENIMKVKIVHWFNGFNHYSIWYNLPNYFM